MIKKYIYKEETYPSSYSVRKAISEIENLAFGPEPEGELAVKQAFWADLGVTYTEEPDPEPTEEELLEQAKEERAKQVAAIKVTVGDKVFDGDEISQSRMARALEVATITGMQSTVWVLADNTVAEVTVDEMKQALSQAMLKMGELWTIPYKENSPTTLKLAKVGI